MLTIIGKSQSGTEVQIEESALHVKLVEYAGGIVDRWSDTLPESSFVSNGQKDDDGEDTVFALVRPEDILALVGATLMLAPDLLGHILNEKHHNDLHAKGESCPECTKES